MTKGNSTAYIRKNMYEDDYKRLSNQEIILLKAYKKELLKAMLLKLTLKYNKYKYKDLINRYIKVLQEEKRLVRKKDI